MGITDGTFVCALCGEWRTGCGMCGKAPMADMRQQIERARAEKIATDAELAAKENAIKRAAEKRF